ncbi:hypothetical protein P0D92_16465 [Pseudomonas sp. CBSPAW29]|nr:hypothetical protein P0D92_16465 [Pseudomonas sp. CBSPAW29]
MLKAKSKAKAGTVKNVGAGLLAKVVNDDAGILDERGALRFFAASPLPQKSSFVFALVFAFAFDLAFNTQAGREAAVLLLLILI